MKRIIICLFISMFFPLFASGNSETVQPAITTPTDSDSKALIVYFSATGNTRRAAEPLADLTGADIFEIVPQEPYTSADLDYGDRSSRSSVEMNDASSRPAIANSLTNLSEYDTIYIGYPIWWSDMPRILYTFFDTYDLSGKTIAPFCTSGGSGISNTVNTIRRLESGAAVTAGLSLRSSNQETSLKSWLEEIGRN